MLEPITASYLPRHHLENVVPSEQLQGYTCEWNFAGIAFIRPGSGERERCTSWAPRRRRERHRGLALSLPTAYYIERDHDRRSYQRTDSPEERSVLATPLALAVQMGGVWTVANAPRVDPLRYRPPLGERALRVQSQRREITRRGTRDDVRAVAVRETARPEPK